MKHLALALIVVASTAHAEDKKYTLADLKALIDQKSYKEALDHLADIAPTERKGEWLEIAGAAGAGMIATTPDAESRLVFMVDIEKKLPALLKAPKYLVARADAAGAGFDACFHYRGSFQECRDYALAFVDADVKNAKLTLDVAKAVRRGMSHFAAVPFFKRALAANKQAVVCADDDLQLAVVSGLGLSKTDSRLDEALALANTCWSDVKDGVLADLTSDSGHYRDTVCPLLVKWRALPADKAKLCAKK